MILSPFNVATTSRSNGGCDNLLPAPDIVKENKHVDVSTTHLHYLLIMKNSRCRCRDRVELGPDKTRFTVYHDAQNGLILHLVSIIAPARYPWLWVSCTRRRSELSSDCEGLSKRPSAMQQRTIVPVIRAIMSSRTAAGPTWQVRLFHLWAISILRIQAWTD